jgi:predicted flap endonuclease-1-like 5' DNA nuclease
MSGDSTSLEVTSERLTADDFAFDVKEVEYQDGVVLATPGEEVGYEHIAAIRPEDSTAFLKNNTSIEEKLDEAGIEGETLEERLGKLDAYRGFEKINGSDISKNDIQGEMGEALSRAWAEDLGIDTSNAPDTPDTPGADADVLGEIDDEGLLNEFDEIDGGVIQIESKYTIRNERLTDKLRENTPVNETMGLDHTVEDQFGHTPDEISEMDVKAFETMLTENAFRTPLLSEEDLQELQRDFSNGIEVDREKVDTDLRADPENQRVHKEEDASQGSAPQSKKSHLASVLAEIDGDEVREFEEAYREGEVMRIGMLTRDVDSDFPIRADGTENAYDILTVVDLEGYVPSLDREARADRIESETKETAIQEHGLDESTASDVASAVAESDYDLEDEQIAELAEYARTGADVGKAELAEQASEIAQPEIQQWQDIEGVGPVIEAKLNEKGFSVTDDLDKSDVEDVELVGEERANSLSDKTPVEQSQPEQQETATGQSQSEQEETFWDAFDSERAESNVHTGEADAGKSTNEEESNFWKDFDPKDDPADAPDVGEDEASTTTEERVEQTSESEGNRWHEADSVADTEPENESEQTERGPEHSW